MDQQSEKNYKVLGHVLRLVRDQVHSGGKLPIEVAMSKENKAIYEKEVEEVAQDLVISGALTLATITTWKELDNEHIYLVEDDPAKRVH